MNIKSNVTAKHFYAQYRRFAGAHTYMIGINRKGKMYYFITNRISERWLRTDHQSSKKGGAQQLKLRIPAKEWDELIASGKAVLIGSVEEVTAQFPCINKKGETYKNAGVSFEKWAANTFCGIADRAKDSDNFTTGGDININGVEVQVKFGTATFCTLKTIHRLQAEARQH